MGDAPRDADGDGSGSESSASHTPAQFEQLRALWELQPNGLRLDPDEKSDAQCVCEDSGRHVVAFPLHTDCDHFVCRACACAPARLNKIPLQLGGEGTSFALHEPVGSDAQEFRLTAKLRISSPVRLVVHAAGKPNELVVENKPGDFQWETLSVNLAKGVDRVRCEVKPCGDMDEFDAVDEAFFFSVKAARCPGCVALKASTPYVLDPSVEPDERHVALVGEQTCRCPARGCGHKGELWGMAKHLQSSCGSAFVHCPFPNCRASGQECGLEVHASHSPACEVMTRGGRKQHVGDQTAQKDHVDGLRKAVEHFKNEANRATGGPNSLGSKVEAAKAQLQKAREMQSTKFVKDMEAYARRKVTNFPDVLGPFALTPTRLHELYGLRVMGDTYTCIRSGMLTRLPHTVAEHGKATTRERVPLGPKGEWVRKLGSSDVRSLCWCYPLNGVVDLSMEEQAATSGQGAEFTFLINGGFALFDAHDQLVATLALGLGEGMEFSPPSKWDNRYTSALKDRFQPITIKALRDVGALKYAWLSPNEGLEVEPEASDEGDDMKADKPKERLPRWFPTSTGGFAYQFEDPNNNVYFHVK